MKKTRFFLLTLLLLTVLVFTGCGNRDQESDTVPDQQQNGIEQDIEDGAEDVKDGAEDIGDDLKDGVDDMADDLDDAVHDDGDRDRVNTDGDVSKNTADNGSRSHVQ